MEEHKDSPKINRSGRIRQPGPSRQVSSVHATIDADTHGDVLNAPPVSMVGVQRPNPGFIQTFKVIRSTPTIEWKNIHTDCSH